MREKSDTELCDGNTTPWKPIQITLIFFKNELHYK